MEGKDVALLGFVQAASKYVDRHMSDGYNLGDLKKINIKKLKDDLSAELKFLSMSDEYKQELVKVGEKAFDEYAKENLGNKKNSVIEELGKIFEVDFDEPTEEEKETKKEIDQLLDAYDLDEKVSVSSSVKNENDDLDDDVVEDFGISDDDDILLTIANAASKSDEELAERFTSKEIKKPEGMDDVYSAVVNNENKPSVVEEKKVQERSAASMYQAPVETNNESLVNVNNPGLKLSEQLSNKKTYQAPVKEKEDVNTSIHVPLSQTLKEIGKPGDLLYKSDLEIEEEYIPKPHPVVTNPGLDIVLEKEKEYEESQTFYDLEKEEDQHSFTAPVENPGLEKRDDPTLSEVLAGLGNLQKKQEEKIVQEQVDPKELIYADIMQAYPYLSKDFIKSAYSQKEEIEDAYKENVEYILLHRLVFGDIDELHEFVEIMMAHDFSVNVDETKMIVDTFKYFINEEGSILTNILSVANQARILNGEYDGYRVIDKEGK